MRITPARDLGTSRNFLVVANSHVPALELVLQRYKTFWEDCDRFRSVDEASWAPQVQISKPTLEPLLSSFRSSVLKIVVF